MSDLVKDTLEGTQRALRKEKAAGNAAMIDDAVSKMSENERAKVLKGDRCYVLAWVAHHHRYLARQTRKTGANGRCL